MTRRLRKLWLQVHRWTGIGIALLAVPIGLSGTLLVWDQEVDALVAPQRYAVTGAQMTLPLSAYVAAGRAALAPPFDVTGLHVPSAEGRPVTLSARAIGADGARRSLTLYLDPPSARVLGAVEGRASFVGFMHRLHGNLLIRDGPGRQIVGWVGVGMLVLSLSGIYLWWPRNGLRWRAFRWRRGPGFSGNLHLSAGIWIAAPLAVLSATGIYLSFPNVSRAAMSSIADMEPRRQRPWTTWALAAQPALTEDAALAAAQAALPGARALSLYLPMHPARAAPGTARPAALWHVQMRDAAGEVVTLTVEDRAAADGADRRVAGWPTPPAGDRAALAIRRLHDGHGMTILWQIVVFSAGIVPAILAVTGVLVWAGRRRRSATARPAP